MNHRISAVLVLAAVAVTGCTSSDGPDDQSSDDVAPTESVETSSTDDGIEAFCVEYDAANVEQPESYVGSRQHVDDVEQLRRVAPEELTTALTTFEDFLASGAVDSEARPSSTLTDNWPIAVQQATTDIQAYGSANC